MSHHVGESRRRAGDRSSGTGLGGVLALGVLSLGLAAAPATLDLGTLTLDGKPAVAKGGGSGGGGGPGGGHGGGGPGGRGGGHGPGGNPGKGPGGDHATGRGNVFDGVPGNALGRGRHDGALAHARDRYNDARPEARGGGAQAKSGGAGLERDVGRRAYGLSRAETEAMIGRGWQGRAKGGDGFRNHGERVSTMVELAKRLGYGAHVGALQANFGTPQENGITALQEQLDEARARGDTAEVERLEAELNAAIANAKPGRGPNDSWATADLDVNGDGVVDRADLDALDATGPGDEAAG